MKSYSARADQLPANAHSTPDTGSPAEIVGGATGERLAEPIDRKVRIVCPDPGTAGLTVEQHTVPCITEFAGRGGQPSTVERRRGGGTGAARPSALTALKVFVVLGSQSNIASAPTTTPPQNS